MTDDLTERVRDELRRIERVVVAITGLSSNWNGEVELVSHPEFKGKKPFSCHILIDQALAEQDVRWRTLIHEALHAVSVGYNQADYNSCGVGKKPSWSSYSA